MSNEDTPSMSTELIHAIDKKIEKVHTQSFDLSFNEILDMSKQGEIDISPEYQRLFRWSEGAQSRFIESLLLEMPVPPIYVLEEEDGKYTLIDGLQRISTYLHLRGHLSAPHRDIAADNMLQFVDCDIVEELNGHKYSSLPTALQIRLKRAFIRVEVVRKGSDPHFKYHMFKRLNTGGTELTPHQVRNCAIRLLNNKFNAFIDELSNESAFACCTSTLTEEQRLGAFNQELVLRYFALKNHRDYFKHDVGDFLTEYMELVTEEKVEFEYETEKESFLKTFRILQSTLAEYAFAYPNKRSSDLTLVRAFGIYQFESFTIGLQAALPGINVENLTQMQGLKTVFNKIKKSESFIDLTTGGGKNSKGPLEQRIEFVKEKVLAYVNGA